MTDKGHSGIRLPWETPPEFGHPKQVAEGVLWLRLPLPMKLDHVNIYILDDGDGWTLVDTGLGGKRAIETWETLLNGPLAGKPVRRVVLTHHHLDHVGLAGWFHETFGAEIVCSRVAWLMARVLQLDVQERPTPQSITFWQRAGMDAGILETRKHSRPFNTADAVYPLAPGFTRLEDGADIRMGQRDWTVRFGQGHAPDHATFWSEDLVLGGDQLLTRISPNLSVYPTEPDADPVGEWLQSCEAFLPFAHADQLVLPGHNLPYFGLPTRLAQLIKNHHTALERLQNHLTHERSAVECFTALFGRKIGEAEYGLALGEAVAHLNHLCIAQKVTRRLDETGVYRWQNI